MKQCLTLLTILVGSALTPLLGELTAAEMTGAEFPVVSPNEGEADRPAIFVGLSEPALARLEPEPLAKRGGRNSLSSC